MSKTFIYGGLLLALLVAPFVGYPMFLMKVLCFALFASAFNLLIGFTGLLSFGHAMFFGFAAYVSGHAAKVWGLTPELAVLCGTLSAALIGVFTGWLAVRRQGIYFAMVTLALAQMVYFICVQSPFTYAEDGIQSIPRGKLFGFLDLSNDTTMYFLVLFIFVSAFARFRSSWGAMTLRCTLPQGCSRRLRRAIRSSSLASRIAGRRIS